MVNRNGVHTGSFGHIHRRGGSHHCRELPDGLTHRFWKGLEER